MNPEKLAIDPSSKQPFAPLETKAHPDLFQGSSLFCVEKPARLGSGLAKQANSEKLGGQICSSGGEIGSTGQAQAGLAFQCQATSLALSE